MNLVLVQHLNTLKLYMSPIELHKGNFVICNNGSKEVSTGYVYTNSIYVEDENVLNFILSMYGARLPLPEVKGLMIDFDKMFDIGE